MTTDNCESNTERRFWEKVGKGEQPGDCWLWTAATSGHMGYGNLYHSCSRNLRGAHRYSWGLHHGVIPEGLHVLHKCDVPTCVNPEHLFLGTNDDNLRDKLAKGRASCLKGEANGRAKLSEQDVRVIRERYASGESQQRIADDYGVDQTAVGFIVRRVHWSHVS
jgi:hypothetical protein